MSTRTSARLRRSKGGFTLFEIIVAIAIVALMLGIVVSQGDRFLELDMKKASNRLASTIRYLYNKSATEGVFIRLVLDLEEQSYWVEATSDPVVVAVGEEGGIAKVSEDESKGGADKKDEDSEATEGEGSEDEEARSDTEVVPSIKPPVPTFGPEDSYLLRPTKLPDSVFFKDLYVEHRQGPVEGGKEAIFFFPNGYVEHAIINLRDEEDETHYSLETNPASGKVNIENEYRSGLEEK